MTASSRYSNPNNPMAAATDGDYSLADFISDFPMKWDNFIQLRMYLGTANAQQYSLHYPTLDIQVTGDTWQAVDGGPVNCAAGTAESIETIVLPSSTTTTVPAPAGHSATSTPAGTTKSSGTTPAGSTGTTSPTREAAPAPAHSTSSSDTGLIAGIVVAGLAAVGLLTYLLVRRRRSAAIPPGPAAEEGPPQDEPSPTPSSPAAVSPSAASATSRPTTTKGH